MRKGIADGGGRPTRIVVHGLAGGRILTLTLTLILIRVEGWRITW